MIRRVQDAGFAGARPTLAPSAERMLFVVGFSAVGLAISISAPFVLIALLAVFVGVAYTRISPGDPTSLATIAIGALFVIPARFVIGPLGAAGTPAVLVGLGSIGWWIADRMMQRPAFARDFQPARLALFALLTAMLVGYGAGWSRTLSPLEGRNADRSVIVWIGMAGLLLLVADGVRTRTRLDELIHRLVLAGSFMSAIAIIQFTLKWDPTDLISVPGLTENVPDVTDGLFRSEFQRVAGTAWHPIEFAVVAASILPLAVYRALSLTHLPPIGRWFPVVLLGFAIPMALSRSAILGILVVGIVLMPTLSPTNQLRLGSAGIGAASAMTVLIPGLLGTILSFFRHTSDDPSVQGRTEDFARVEQFFSESPIWGRGFGTYTPVEYDFLDNQYFMTLIESGLIGLGALLLFFAVGFGLCAGVRRRATDEPTRTLAQALVASIAVHFVTFATYDALVFRISGMALFLSIGMAAALWRLTRLKHPNYAEPRWFGPSAGADSVVIP